MGAVRGKVIAPRGAAIAFSLVGPDGAVLAPIRRLRRLRRKVEALSEPGLLVPDSVLQLPNLQRGQKQALGARKRADGGTDRFSIDGGSALGTTFWDLRSALGTRTNSRLAVGEVPAWIQRCHNYHNQ